MSSLKHIIPGQIKKPINDKLAWLHEKITWPYRQRTWRSRALPDFIIIGAQKSGTTSLFAYLRQHPQLFPSSKKEVLFFNNPDHFIRGEAWYRAHFPLRKSLSLDAKTYEASPHYMYHPLAPKRIYDLIPDVKIIAVLRNPAERAISNYFHVKWNSREPLPLYEALQEEEKRLEPALKAEDYSSEVLRFYSYKRRGLYKEQLERYLDYFPWEQILVLNSEALFREPEASLRQIFDFVGVDREVQIKDLRPRGITSSKVEVDSAIYDYLSSYFKPHNQALYQLVGKDYGW